MEPAARTDPAFDTAAPGEPEAHWSAWAEGLLPWVPAPRPLVVVSPHPDDETLGAGGLISTWISSGYAVTVISVTDGEAAREEVPDLAAVRRRELVHALSELGSNGLSLVHLQMPDGGVSGREDELTRALSAHVTKRVTLVGPFERDGHPDHDAVGKACRRIALSTGAAYARYPIWAWFRGSPELRNNSLARKFELSSTAREAKQRAIGHFQSQLEARPGGAIVPPHVLPYFDRPYEAFLL